MFTPAQLRSAKLLTGADPAAGSEISYTHSGSPVALLAVRFSLVTSGTVANRRVRIVVDDGATEFARVSSLSDQTATLTWDYAAGANVDGAAVSALFVQLPLPTPLVLQAGWRVRTLTSAIQAGDNFSAPVLYAVDLQGY